jgi:membrane-bound serine protease (ClpP class)
VITLVALVVALLFLSPPWSYVLVAVAAAVDVAETGAFLWWSRRRRRRTTPAVGVEALVGRHGRATTRLAPSGQVRVGGELWSARSTTPVDRGDAIVVLGIHGLVLDVDGTGDLS